MPSATARISHPSFLSTPSARRATPFLILVTHDSIISIHALREEGDLTDPDRPAFIQQFLSTPSARRATTPFRFTCQ